MNSNPLRISESLSFLFLDTLLTVLIFTAPGLMAQSIDRSLPWTVFTPADNTLPMGPNLLLFPGADSIS